MLVMNVDKDASPPHPTSLRSATFLSRGRLFLPSRHLRKPEFVDLSDFILQNMNDLQTVAFVPLAYDPVANRNDSEQKLKEVKI